MVEELLHEDSTAVSGKNTSRDDSGGGYSCPNSGVMKEGHPGFTPVRSCRVWGREATDRRAE
jgi:hypothetical protein